MSNEHAKEIMIAYRDRLISSCSNQLDSDIEAFNLAIKALEDEPQEEEKLYNFVSSPTEVIKVGEPISNSDEINKALEKGKLYKQGFEDAVRRFKRPQGEWLHRRIITKDRSFDMVVCSNCQTEFSWDAETGVSMDNYKTCPNCGADMRGKEE